MNCVHQGNSRAGFAALEIVFVLILVGLFVGVLVPRVNEVTGYARQRATRQSLMVVRDALDSYRSLFGKYPAAADLKDGLAPHLNGPFPQASIGNRNADVARTTQEPVLTPEPGTAAWVYNDQTGAFHVNHADGIGW